MDRAQLLALDQMAQSTPGEIKTKSPGLFTQLQNSAASDLTAAVASHFERSSPQLKDLMSKVSISPTVAREGFDLKQNVLESLRKQNASPAVLEEAQRRLETLKAPAHPEDVLQSDIPIAANPIFRADLADARLHRLATIVDLPETKVNAVVQSGATLASLDDAALDSLVASNKLAANDAKELGLTASLYRVFDENVALTEAAKKGAITGIPGNKVNDIHDLIHLDQPGWNKVLEDSKVDPPGGLSRAEYATVLTKRVETIYPSDTLLARLKPPGAQSLTQDLTNVLPLFARNPLPFNLDHGLLDMQDVSPQQQEQVRASFNNLKRFALTYPGLGFKEILNDNTVPSAERIKRANDRVALMTKFQAANPEVEFLSLDYSTDSEDVKVLKFDGVAPADQRAVLSNLKAYQRTFSISRDLDHSKTMLAAGYDSASKIMSAGFERFQADTGFETKIAQAYFTEAKHAISTISAAMGAILDALKGGLRHVGGVGNLGPSLPDFFKKIDGFEGLFGSQQACQCKHCQSIISPAAYFVDLMHFVETNLLDKVFTGLKKNHALNLKVRRPDLWQLPLTCENTDTEIPQLIIVCEILENYIAMSKGLAGDLNNRTAVETAVYRDQLQNSVASFTLPFMLPLEKLRVYLTHFDRTRGEIARLLETADPVLAAACLELSKKEYDVVTTPNIAAAFLRQVYNLQFQIDGTGKVTAFEAHDLLSPMGLKRAELSDMVATRFVSAQGAESVDIKSEKRSPDSVQNDIERIYNLRATSLDRMHRFTRVWRKLGWTIREVDLLLFHLNHAGLGAGLDANSLRHLADILFLQRRFKAKVEELCPLFDLIPTAAVSDKDKPLFDRVFNLQDFVSRDGTWPKDAVKFVHPSLRTSGPSVADTNAVNRLLAGLRIEDGDLALLINSLAAALGLNLASASDEDKGFNLTVANLSILYRHTRAAEWLHLSIDELFQLLRLAPGLAGPQLVSLSDVLACVKFHTWWKQSGYSLNELAYVTGKPVPRPGDFPDSAQMARDILDQVIGDRALVFTNTVFAVLPGVNEAASRAIVAANPNIVATPDGRSMWLAPAFSPTTPLTIPGGVTVNELAARAALIVHHASALIPKYLSGKLGLTLDKIKAVIALTGANLADPDFTRILQGALAPAKLANLIKALLPLKILFKAPIFDPDTLGFIKINSNAMFGIADFTPIPVQAVQRVSLYKGFVRVGDTGDNNGAEVRSVLQAFTPANKFAAANQAVLAKVLQSDLGLVIPLQASVQLPTTPLEALDKLRRTAELANWTGVGGEIPKLIVSENYDDLAQASDAVLGGFRAKYPDEKEWRDKIKPFQEQILNRRRDGVTNFLLYTTFPAFKTPSDLYRYFLIDSEVDGCFATSRLVAAISSLQLYVHRAQMNLEQDTAGNIYVSPDFIPEEEWEWRQHYRVWEANRKVFLWPENYILPDLRDDKTPVFKDLESTLLQREINAQNVLDAYGTYMQEFEEVASLRIAGSYHDINNSKEVDVLHLIGVTPGDPPLFYYRAVENAYYGALKESRGTVWGPWQKIDVKVPVRKVAPVMFNGRLHIFWVEISSTSQNVVTGGGSQFVGYTHKLSLKYSSLRLDGRWTPPQKISLYGPPPFQESDGIVDDPLAESDEWKDFMQAILGSLGFGIFSNSTMSVSEAQRKLLTPRYDTEMHTKARDGYTLRGSEWDQFYPTRYMSTLLLVGAGYQMRAWADLFDKTTHGAGGAAHGSTKPVRTVANYSPPKPVLCSTANRLYYGMPSFAPFDSYSYCSLILDAARINRITDGWTSVQKNQVKAGLYTNQIATLQGGTELAVINGSLVDGIIDASGDTLLLQSSVRQGNRYLLRRLGTTLGQTAARALFTRGVEGLLDINTQKGLKESNKPITLFGNRIEDKVNAGKLDFTGPYGVYYREIFFHIPFLIANNLNSQHKFRDAQLWYHHIFNPTSTEIIPNNPALTPAENEARKKDRNWKYLEFRRLDVPSLRQVLTDPVAIEAYKKDPFNPHAIARLRLSAYQKTIVMRYVDNLLDWADDLFTQFQMETVNEATMLYVTAADILGMRPAELGECGEGAVTPRSYEKIKPLIHGKSEFLVELEHWIWVKNYPSFHGKFKISSKYVLDLASVISASNLVAHLPAVKAIGITQKSEPPVATLKTAASVRLGGTTVSTTVAVHETELTPAFVTEISNRVSGTAVLGKVTPTSTGIFFDEQFRGAAWKDIAKFKKGIDHLPHFGWGVLKHVSSPVFCIPENEQLLGYWNRVEDRLFKIRNCMDITGAKRRLSLFAPPIDPMLLVRAKAAGLSIEDVLNSIDGNLPPYRFAYLIERAKALAGAVQSFGGQLLSAMEKKDMEDLNLLRTTQQDVLLKMTNKVRQAERDGAQATLDSLQRSRDAADFRRTYYKGLMDTGLTDWEVTQQVSRHLASILHAGEAPLLWLAGALHLIPDVGSPFAMKYGGTQTGQSTSSWAIAMRALADIADNVAASAGLEAGFQRRKEGWKFQMDSAEKELATFDKQIEAAQLRLDIADRSIELHQKGIDQNEELYNFFRDKLTNLGLYTWMSTMLQRVHRDCYNTAYAIARLAEQAYHFERDDDTELLSGKYWDSAHAGLLAGALLTAELLEMERKFLENNYRDLEIDQSFSLTQINPGSLVRLQQQGECEFDLAEPFYDLFYPGQYRRKIKSVRLTIPCITGPYTNVSATLTLTRSKIRKQAAMGADKLLELPVSRTTTIATSTAQNDGGVFELNFRDERYMPFEGAGAVSSWKLTLPKSFRQFDYQTINDVIVHVSYTAKEDGVFRTTVENVLAAAEGSLLDFLQNNNLPRAFSLRQQFSSEFNQLLHRPANTPVSLELKDKHFPIFLKGRSLVVKKAVMVLQTAPGQNANNFQVAFNGTAIIGFAADPQFGGLPTRSMGSVFGAGLLKVHTLTVANAGALAPTALPPGDVSALDSEKLTDIYLYLEYGAS